MVINLTISIFTVVLAGMQLVYGPLVDSRGRRAMLLPGVALYAAASVGCALAPDVNLLLAFRALQAAGIAAGSVVAVTVIGDLFGERERGRAMGTFQMLVALGAVAGPVAGGLIGARFGHPGIFLTLAGLAGLILIALAGYVPETRPVADSQHRRIGVRDFARIAAAPQGSGIILLGFVQYYTFYCFLVFLPGILQQTYGFSPERTGAAFLPLSLGVVVGSLLGGRLQERWEAARFLVTSSLVNAVSVLAFAILAESSLTALIAACAGFGLFLGLSLPVQTSLLAGAFVRDRGTAIGVYNLARYLGMAVGPILGTVLFRWGRIPLLFGFSALAFAAAVWFCHRRLALAAAQIG